MQLKTLFFDSNRKCEFHPGFNIILGKNHVTQDESSDEEQKAFSDTNGLGKTLIVNSVKYVLGGDSSDHFESDFFSRNKFWIRLEVSIKNKSKVLMRPLHPDLRDAFFVIFEGTLDEHLKGLGASKRKLESIETPSDVSTFFQGKKDYLVFGKDEFKKHISKIEQIDYSKGNISFSSLLDFIIRDEKEGFSDPISRIGRQTWVQYRAAQYLFGLPSFIEESAGNLQDQISSKRSTLDGKKRELQEKSIKSIDKIENLKLQTHRKLEQVRKEIDSLDVSSSLEEVRKQYSEQRLNLLETNQKINQLESYVSGYQRNLEDLNNKSSALSELLEIDTFYNDLIGHFPPQIKSNFEQYSSFFESVSSDRKEYYEKLILEQRSELKSLKLTKNDFEKEVQNLAHRFKSTSIVRDVGSITSREEQLKSELLDLNRLRDVLLECEGIELEIELLEKEREAVLKRGKTEEKKGRDQRSELIKIFQELVLQIYQTQDGILEFDYNHDTSSSLAGRTEILCSIPSQGSHGRTYGKINIFDFVWFLRKRNAEEFDPGFLIHDGSYAKISKEVKQRMLNAVISRIGTEKQYIITLNEGELQNLADYEKFVCCKLDGSSTGGKFFGEQF